MPAIKRPSTLFLGDAMYTHDGMRFTTSDRDNDGVPGANCAAADYGGAFWYNDCQHNILNGKYFNSSYSNRAYGIIWETWHGPTYSLKSTTMMIKKKCT